MSKETAETLAEGLKLLDEFIEESGTGSSMNEASTRFHIIDNILRCLGWDDKQFGLERYEKGDYTDYELGNPRALILEAKKTDVFFELPVNPDQKVIQCLASLLKTSPSAKSAVEQVQKYCADRGVKPAVVSNGNQYIAFVATRDDGISPFDGKCLVFSSLNHLRKNFELAWQSLSPDGIRDYYLQRVLKNGDVKIPRKLSQSLSVFPRHRKQSDLHNSLRTLSELLIQDIFENDELEQEFISNCYCESGALSKDSLLSKNIMNARYASIFDSDESQIITSDVRSKGKNTFDHDVIAESLNKRPIVLLGDVGVGKTSFIKNLRYNTAYDEFSRSIFINIDLGSSATLTSNLHNFVIEEVKEQLYDNYEIDINSSDYINGVYSKEIQKFSSSIYGSLKESNPSKYEEKKLEMLLKKIENESEHLRKTIDYASKKLRRQIIIVIDNADQRDFKTQQDAFLISQELAKKWNAIVFVSVRPKTFFESKKSGALSAYPNKIFTIRPPRIEQVIRKRLVYATQVAEGKISNEQYMNFLIRSENLVTFLTSLVHSLDTNKELSELITNITGGNVRLAIDIVKGFIGSPNVEVEKIIAETETKEDPYYIKLHEFSKSILLGELYHYSDESSISMNIYDVKSNDMREHFICSLIVAYLHEGARKDKDGFATFKSVFLELQNQGFNQSQINLAIEKMINKKLIETNKRFTYQEEDTSIQDYEPTLLRCTSAGIYHVYKWAPTFVYLDAISHDTPIFENKVYDSILPDVESIHIVDRNNRVKAIKQYLLDCWRLSNLTTDYYNFEHFLAQGEHSFSFVEFACQQIEKDSVHVRT